MSKRLFFFCKQSEVCPTPLLCHKAPAFYTEMITQKQVEILIQLQKVFGPNMLDDLLAKIIGSRNMQTVLILSHFFFRFLTFCSNFISNKHENHNRK